MDGVIVVHKEAGYTSRDVVNIVSKYLNIKKIGHTGTLDPLASGVLVLCVGKATKLVELITNFDKEYIASVTLGMQTDTLDIQGNILKEENVYRSKDEILKVLNEMVGFYEQEVPLYSAVKVNGKKLYQYARENISVNLPKRRVEIKKIELLDTYYSNNKTTFKIKCVVSKGTYIRSLIKDIGFKLNTIATMSDLIRTRQGNFNIADSYYLKDILNGKYKMIPIGDLLDIPKIEIADDMYFKIKNGQIIDKKWDSDLIGFIYNNEVIAIYKTYNDKYLKPYKMFL